MADIKISQLGAAVEVADSDIIPATVSGVTVKVPVSVLKEHIIGDTSISGIGDGSPTGAIDSLNTNKVAKSEVATIETTVASKAYTAGDQLYYGGVLHVALVDIASGTTFAVGTNISPSSKIADQISSNDADIHALQTNQGTLSSLTTDAKGSLVAAINEVDAHADIKVKRDDLTNIDITGTTNNTGSTISSGTFFYLNGTLVRAKTDIANGATFTANTNYEVVTVGSLNILNEALSVQDISNLFTATANVATVLSKQVYKYGKVVFGSIVFNPIAMTNLKNASFFSLDSSITPKIGFSPFAYLRKNGESSQEPLLISVDFNAIASVGIRVTNNTANFYIGEVTTSDLIIIYFTYISI